MTDNDVPSDLEVGRNFAHPDDDFTNAQLGTPACPEDGTKAAEGLRSDTPAQGIIGTSAHLTPALVRELAVRSAATHANSLLPIPLPTTISSEL